MDYPACIDPACSGIQLPEGDRCLAHAGEVTRDAFLSGALVVAELDLRGTPLSRELVQRVVNQFFNPHAQKIIGRARFDHAKFGQDVTFSGVTFSGDVWFDGATFEDAVFDGARFEGAAYFTDTVMRHAVFAGALFLRQAHFAGVHVKDEARFTGATFTDHAMFNGAKFDGATIFSEVTFGANTGALINFAGTTFRKPAIFLNANFLGAALWGQATFADQAWFESATFYTAQFIEVKFERDTSFSGASFAKKVEFDRSTVSGVAQFGPFVSGGPVTFTRAVFEVNPSLEVAAPSLALDYVKFNAGGSVQLRYADVTLEHATFGKPTTLMFAQKPFTVPVNSKSRRYLDDDAAQNKQATSARPRLLSVRNMDGDSLSIWGIDLSQCLFVGAHRLDQVRLEGVPSFGTTPRGWHFRLGWRPLWRWSHRQTVIEEHHWRASQSTKYEGWQSMDQHPFATDGDRPLVHVKSPGELVSVYRALRRALENSKDEPGAADFYYGEMEMRRKAAARRFHGRPILWLYWLFSGYGLRATRALVALLLVLVFVTGGLVTSGLPNRQTGQQAAGTISGATQPGQSQAVTLNLTSPQATLTGSLADRWTGERLERAGSITLNAVLFRATDQQLTEPGKYIEMLARVLGPALLALALLAIRNRVKR